MVLGLGYEGGHQGHGFGYNAVRFGLRNMPASVPTEPITPYFHGENHIPPTITPPRTLSYECSVWVTGVLSLGYGSAQFGLRECSVWVTGVLSLGYGFCAGILSQGSDITHLTKVSPAPRLLDSCLD